MSKEILENNETPIEDEMIETPSEEVVEEIIELPQRMNPFCVISKATYGKYAVRDIQTNSGWSENPYPDYAVVPDDMVQAIKETKGFCDIVLNEDGTEVVEFTALEIPDIPNDVPEQVTEDSVWDDMAVAIEEGVNEV